MESANKALEKYTKVQQERKELIAAHKEVFDKFEAIGLRIIDADNELRDAISEYGAGVENDQWVVTIMPQTQTFADIEVIDEMIANGVQLTPARRSEIVKTVERPLRISIKPVV